MKELTKTQYKIAELVSLGNSEKEIANLMFVSINTVHTHTYHIRKKLQARSAVDIARKFILSLDDPKKYFAAFLFLTIQLNILVQDEIIDLRRSKKTSSRSRAGIRSNGRIKYL